MECIQCVFIMIVKNNTHAQRLNVDRLKTAIKDIQTRGHGIHREGYYLAKNIRKY